MFGFILVVKRIIIFLIFFGEVILFFFQELPQIFSLYFSKEDSRFEIVSSFCLSFFYWNFASENAHEFDFSQELFWVAFSHWCLICSFPLLKTYFELSNQCYIHLVHNCAQLKLFNDFSQDRNPQTILMN